MKIATWNINSIKVRLAHVLQWLAANPVDVLCLQELKLPDEQFPTAELAAAGYTSYIAGQKTYNGVAMLVRQACGWQTQHVIRNLSSFDSIDNTQRRLIAATVGNVRIVNTYFPNGQALASDKFAYKLAWMTALSAWLEGELASYQQLVLLGDFNIAPHERDVHDPQAWEGQNLVSPQERAAFSCLQALGLHDAFRLFEQPEKSFSWWDYRMLAFKRNAGLRIDHILLSSALAKRCTDCRIDRTPRRWVQPSDHAPVIATLALN